MSHHSRPVTYYGIKFESLTEGARYLILRDKEQRGDIRGLKCHPKYVLVPAFNNEVGEHTREIGFSPDFEYWEDGRRIVEDVKPWRFNRKLKPPRRAPVLTEDFQLKRKIFMYQHQDVDFRITGDREDLREG